VSEVSESIAIDATLAEVWEYHFEPAGWPVWVDGFGSVTSSEAYPLAGGKLRWRSSPAGRGEVAEEVLEHEPRRLHRIAFTDPQTEGELRTEFQIKGQAVVVTQTLSYRLSGGGVFGFVSDKLFIRSQQRRSIQRSLLRLKREVEERAAA
jgi:uncharacterized membrane protein